MAPQPLQRHASACVQSPARTGVLIDISGEGDVVGFVVDQLGEEASFEDVPYEPVPSIDAQCVALIQDPHADREIRLLSADEKVIVVRHQAVPIAAPGETTNALRQILEEPRPIKVVVCDRRPSDAARCDVVRGSCRNDLRARSLHVVMVRPAQRSAQCPAPTWHAAATFQTRPQSRTRDTAGPAVP